MQFGAEFCGEKEEESVCYYLSLKPGVCVRVCLQQVGLDAPPFLCIRLSPRLRAP
jgi:hypothetical protein